MLRGVSSTFAVLASLAAGFLACVDEPRFAIEDGAVASPAPPRPGEVAKPRMVFIAGIAVDVPLTGPSSNAGEDGDAGKGKDKGKKDAGSPPPPPPPPPEHPNTIHLEVAGFFIDATEVTAEAFRACVDAGACSAPASGAGCTMGAGLGPHPINCVTLEQARSYCGWTGKRLVRSDEWTAAAAGAQLRPYPWGNEPPTQDRLNACGGECSASGMYSVSDGQVRTAPPGTFPLGVTPDGVEDLGGNVAEWVESEQGPMARGGSFEDTDVAQARSFAARVVTQAGATVGFRCAADR